MRGSPHQEGERSADAVLVQEPCLGGRKIIRHTRTAVRTATEAEAHIQQALVELFGEEPDLELEQDQEQQDQEQEEPQAQAPISIHTCSLQSLGGY